MRDHPAGDAFASVSGAPQRHARCAPPGMYWRGIALSLLIPLLLAAGREPVSPLPPPPPQDPLRVELGRKLFYDTRLSRDHTISCGTCHELGGIDGRPVAIGAAGRAGTRNTPTVMNSSLNPILFWDGRARGLEEQVSGPLLNPLEMDSDWELVLSRATTSARTCSWSGSSSTAATIR